MCWTSLWPTVPLDINALETDVRRLFDSGIAPATKHSYNSAQRHLCIQPNLSPFPTSSQIPCSFVTFLASQALKYQTTKCYLSAVRHAQIEAGLHDPFHNTDLSRLETYSKASNVNKRPRVSHQNNISQSPQPFFSNISGIHMQQTTTQQCSGPPAVLDFSDSSAVQNSPAHLCLPMTQAYTST